MGKKEQVPARAIFVQGSLWVWSATSRGRPPDGGLSGVVRARRARARRFICAQSPLPAARPPLSRIGTPWNTPRPPPRTAPPPVGAARGAEQLDPSVNSIRATRLAAEAPPPAVACRWLSFLCY